MLKKFDLKLVSPCLWTFASLNLVLFLSAAEAKREKAPTPEARMLSSRQTPFHHQSPGKSQQGSPSLRGLASQPSALKTTTIIPSPKNK